MTKLLAVIALLSCLPVHAQTVFASTDGNGNVTGFYANAAPVPTPPNCCTQMSMSDSRISAYLNPVPTVAQLYASAINVGLTVISTATPALNGTYPIDPTSQFNISSEIVSIQLNGAFTNGQQAKPWMDSNGAAHTFTIAQFKTFATAVSQYVDALVTARSSVQVGQPANWPTATATIP